MLYHLLAQEYIWYYGSYLLQGIIPYLQWILCARVNDLYPFSIGKGRHNIMHYPSSDHRKMHTSRTTPALPLQFGPGGRQISIHVYLLFVKGINTLCD